MKQYNYPKTLDYYLITGPLIWLLKKLIKIIDLLLKRVKRNKNGKASPKNS